MSQEQPTKEELAAIFEELDKRPMPVLGPGPHTVEEDANGVVHLFDKDGAERALMPKDVYEEILEYKVEKEPAT